MKITDVIADRLGPGSVMTDPADMHRYLEEPRGLYLSRAQAVVRPRSTAEVAAVLAICNESGTSVVPQGGNTGLVAGSVTDGGLILSLERMDKIRSFDSANATMTVEAGAVLANVQKAAEESGLFFPLSLAAEGTCTIGGNLATNAGGTSVLRYGNARDLCLGLEVVLADGRIMRNLKGLRKDNSGYDLKHLFIGSEGTLGVITACVLRLYPRPAAKATAFLGLASPDKARHVFEHLRTSCGDMLTAFELLPHLGLENVLTHISQAAMPLRSPHNWYALVEISSLQSDDDLDERLAKALHVCLELDQIEDATLSSNQAQSAMFWRLRECLSEAQGLAGSVVKHDISVPVSAVPAFLQEASAAVEQVLPGTRPCPFGHMGDGNIHFNLSPPAGMDDNLFLSHWPELNAAVHGTAHRFGGSIAAEHGIGLSKRDELPIYKDPVALDIMKMLKNVFDPKGILNPGKVIASGAGAQLSALPAR